MVAMSLPSRGAWIEISPKLLAQSREKSLPSRGAWIEIQAPEPSGALCMPSLPSRGAWIEIDRVEHLKTLRDVAPLAGSVD